MASDSDSLQHRHQRLLTLWTRWRLAAIANGTSAQEKDFAQHIGLSAAQWSQHKAGKPLGQRLARRVEQACQVPSGWLDQTDDQSDFAANGTLGACRTWGVDLQPTHLKSDRLLELLEPAHAPAAMLAALGPGASWVMPQVGHSTPAGFPSPAADFETHRVDLSELMQLNEPSTFVGRVRGQSMMGKGIDDGDLLVINRLTEPRHGDTVVAVIDNELTCKTLYRAKGLVKLQAANPEFPDIVLKPDQTLMIWGVVTSVIKRLRT